MFFLVFTRLVSFLAMAGLSGMQNRMLALSVFVAVLFCHYLVQIIYSPRQVLHLVRKDGFFRGLLLAPLTIFVMKTSYISLAVFFGIHFLLTEIYNQAFVKVSSANKWSRMLTTFGIYSLCMSHTEEFQYVPRSVALGIGASGLLGLFVLAVRSEDQGRDWGFFTYEMVGLIGASLLPAGRLELVDIVFYHLVWWAIYPLKAMPARTVRNYLGWTAVLTGGFFAITPPSGFFNFSINDLTQLGNDLGYIHIGLSFALSAANPVWINRIFQPRTAVRKGFARGTSSKVDVSVGTRKAA